MNKILLFFALSFTLCAQLTAQTTMVDMSGEDSMGREYVDLDLPGGVLWATCNVGASKPEESGLYIAWGEAWGYARSKSHSFDWNQYRWYNASTNTLRKYWYDAPPIELYPEDDAATDNWGSDWRMPSTKEISDLIDKRYTTTERVTVNGVEGLKITSKSNGNSIFLPASGERYNESLLYEGKVGRYWSRNITKSFNKRCFLADCLEFNSAESVSSSMRYEGLTVRAVRVTSKMAASEYIDLGLPGGVLWATCNVGASRPEDFGNYFAWGETEGFAGYTEHMFNLWNYRLSKGGNSIYSKYCIYPSFSFCDQINGKTDNKIILEAEDDAATANWGNDWRMPTRQEIEDLIDPDYTTIEEVTLNGVKGRKITSKSNGNSIFLPATGSRWVDEHNRNGTVRGDGTNAYYWSSTLNNKHGNMYAYCLGYNYKDISCHSYYRESGFCVRPVRNPAEPTKHRMIPSDYVDLDLPGGVLWATCNVGASKPEESGKYYAWGETIGYSKDKNHIFDWSTYNWCNGGENYLTKYCTDYYKWDKDMRTSTDKITELLPEDDAATVNWGTDWRMPTSQEMEDLFNKKYTTTKWETVNGVKGRRITSKSNGNSIFLPASGTRYNESLLYEGEEGHYWTSSLSTGNGANKLNFKSRHVDAKGSSYRYNGNCVRAVRAQTK